MIRLAPRKPPDRESFLPPGAGPGGGPVQGRLLRGLDRSGRNSYYFGMKATVSEKGQVTIPKPLRDRLGIRPGQVLDFQAEGGRLVAVKTAPQDPVESVYGILKLGQRTDALIEALRGRADTV